VSFEIAGTDESVDYATTALHHAADLWSVVDPERGERIRRWIEDEWSVRDDDDRIRVYDVDSLRRLAALLDGLDEALRAGVTDWHFRLGEAAAARVAAVEPTLVDSWVEGGATIHSVANRIGEIDAVAGLVRRAIDQGRAIEVG
jgi:hypothetical protein